MNEEMLKKMASLVSKKKDKQVLDEDEKMASLSVLEDMKDFLEKSMSDGMVSAKISASSPEGLKKGAKVLQDEAEIMSEDEEDKPESPFESTEESEDDSEDEDEDEEETIEALQAKIDALKAKKGKDFGGMI